MADFSRFTELDRRLVAAARPIKVLSTLSWPSDHFETFIKGVRAGKPKLPKLEWPKSDHSLNVSELKRVMGEVDKAHPVGKYIYDTADSYVTAATMLENVGHPVFTEISGELYGRPKDAIVPGGETSLETAAHFIEGTRDFAKVGQIPEADPTVSAENAAKELEKALVPFFSKHKIEVTLDPGLSAKAAGGAKRIRLRAGTLFTPLDIPQLLHHEGFVHMLTGLNGGEQQNLPSLALGSPRTTATQEGLATFAELVTSSMDVARLERIALRIQGIQMALDGANFIDVFRYFSDTGQEAYESFQSTARIFRGGDPKGKIVFTKDSVYLRGLIFTHTFLRKAVQMGKFHYAERLVAGRFALGDIMKLEGSFESGFISPPLYEPPWLKNRTCLAAYLSYAVFVNRIHLPSINLSDF